MDGLLSNQSRTLQLPYSNLCGNTHARMSSFMNFGQHMKSHSLFIWQIRDPHEKEPDKPFWKLPAHAGQVIELSAQTRKIFRREIRFEQNQAVT